MPYKYGLVTRNKEGGSRNKRIKIKTILFIALPLILIAISAYLSYFFLNNNIVVGMSNEALNRYIINRDMVSSTLFVVEGSVNQRITGAWYVVSNKQSGKSFIYYVPQGVYIKDYSYKVSDYIAVSDLKYAGGLINKDRNLEYSIWQLNNLTGITIDSYVWLDQDSMNEFASLFGDVSEFDRNEYIKYYANPGSVTQSSLTINSLVSKMSLYSLLINPVGTKNLFSSINSNLKFFELLQRINQINSDIASGEVVMIDLTQEWATNKAVSSVGMEINVVNTIKVDEKLNEVINILKGRSIEKEQVKVEVYNGSGIDGLAYRYYRKLKNAGLEVVRYENAPDQIEVTQVFVPKIDKYANSLDMAKRILVIPFTQIESRPNFMTTGDIVIILGKDMGAEANWK